MRYESDLLFYVLILDFQKYLPQIERIVKSFKFTSDDNQNKNNQSANRTWIIDGNNNGIDDVEEWENSRNK